MAHDEDVAERLMLALLVHRTEALVSTHARTSGHSGAPSYGYVRDPMRIAGRAELSNQLRRGAADVGLRHVHEGMLRPAMHCRPASLKLLA